MAYRLRKKKPVQHSLRRIAREQIDKAIREISEQHLARDEMVHQVRKRCKKLRGLVRLVRPVFADYQQENRFFRDAARELSCVRDAHVLIETLEQLLQHYDTQIDRDAFAGALEALGDRRAQIMRDQVDLDARLENFVEQMREARLRAAHWKIKEDGFDAIAGGLQKTYGRGRKALRRARQEPDMAHLHEWRKRSKYHWYHNRLLRGIWPAMMQVQCDASDRLGDLLGDEHDLAVLHGVLAEQPEQYGGPRDMQALAGLIQRRRSALQTQAWPLGERLFSETPERLVLRVQGYWDVWRADPDRSW